MPGGSGAKFTLVPGEVASDNLRNSNDVEKHLSTDTYTKLKEVKLNADLAGCRIKFDLKNGTATFDATAKIYKNGVAIGTERSVNPNTYQTFSEDFTGFVNGDLIQIYVNGHASSDAYVRNMRFYYDLQIISLGSDTLVTPLLTTSDPTISMTNQDP